MIQDLLLWVYYWYIIIYMAWDTTMININNHISHIFTILIFLNCNHHYAKLYQVRESPL